MARLTKPILGELNGKIGSLVIRTVNNKQFVSLRPEHYRKSTSAKAIYEKNKFSAVVKLAKLLNSVPEIKKVWQQSVHAGFSSYHKILKANLNTFGNENSSHNFTLFPLLKNKFNINLSLVGYKASISLSQKLLNNLDKNFIGTLYLLKMFYPKGKFNKPNFEIRAFSLAKNSFSSGTFEMDINPTSDAVADIKINTVFYFSLLFSSSHIKKIAWTNTFKFKPHQSIHNNG